MASRGAARELSHVEDELVQHVESTDSEFSLQEHDLHGCPNVERELDRRMREEASLPFDLQHGATIRGQLLKLREREHALVITMHHIASDTCSLKILCDEMNALYRAYHDGQKDCLAPLPIQYADYATWERRRLAGGALQRQVDYWCRTLHGAPALLELPSDRPRPAQQDFTGDVVGLELDAALTQGLIVGVLQSINEPERGVCSVSPR